MRKSEIINILVISFLSISMSAQDCIVISDKPVVACLSNVLIRESSLKSLSNTPPESLEQLFYQYFAGTDYTGYKNLFLAADWYGLTTEKFNSWRTFVHNGNLNMIGLAEIRVGSADLGIVKYVHTIDDELNYETFLAKRVGSTWRPASVTEERDYLFYTHFIRFTKLDYLQSLRSELSRNPNMAVPGVSNNSRILAARMLMAKDSLQAFDDVTFKQRYNREFDYLTSAKYDEDREHDSLFVTYLHEMQLSQADADVVMKYIHAQDYLNAAQKADDFSAVSYTYAPFVDKIREIYGRDRIKKWDPVNKKWD